MPNLQKNLGNSFLHTYFKFGVAHHAWPAVPVDGHWRRRTRPREDLKLFGVGLCPGWNAKGDQITRLLRRLSDRYHKQVLPETLWRCLACNEKATEVISRPWCFLPQKLILNSLVLVCLYGECEHLGMVHLNAMHKVLSTNIQRQSGSNLSDGKTHLLYQLQLLRPQVFWAVPVPDTDSGNITPAVISIKMARPRQTKLAQCVCSATLPRRRVWLRLLTVISVPAQNIATLYVALLCKTWHTVSPCSVAQCAGLTCSKHCAWLASFEWQIQKQFCLLRTVLFKFDWLRMGCCVRESCTNTHWCIKIWHTVINSRKFVAETNLKAADSWLDYNPVIIKALSRAMLRLNSASWASTSNDSLRTNT